MSAVAAEELVPREETGGEPVVLQEEPDAALTDVLLRPIWTRWRWFKYAFGVTALGTLALFAALGYTVVTGIGLWGNNIPVAWAFAITNFVWWIGIGHAGTFISAILLLLEVKWRTSINRFAEAMTLFAVMQAGIFPLIHLGRPWFFYWLVPYPSEMGTWPQFRSALAWDIAAVTTYLTVSFLFWYTGLVPDLAAARDRATWGWRKRVYGLFALGWRGSAHHWRHYKTAYLILGGIATPLVLSVHTVVSFDFATSQLPGWHSTMFPPYFVAGAIYSGFAMVAQLLIPARKLFGLHNVVTKNHLDNIAKMLLVTGWIVTYSYMAETFMGWYSHDTYEHYMSLIARPTGPYAPVFWLVIFCNCVVVQLFWSKRVRTNAIWIFAVSCFIQLGMWLERFMLIVTSQSQDFLTSSWELYRPTWVDLTILSGTIFFFLFLFLLFLRFVPFIPISELKEMQREMRKERRTDATEGARPHVA